MVDGYIASEELEMMRQLENQVPLSSKQIEMASFALSKAHADKRAAEAEHRAADAEYRGFIMQLLWKYKLESTDSFRQSDGFIIKGDKHVKGNDTSSKSEKNKRNG